MSTASDWTQQDSQPTTPTGSDDFNPDDYSFIPLAAAPDAEAIEQESTAREFREIEPGDHELFVKGFKGRPVTKLREGYLRGVRVSWESDMVMVRLAKVGEPQASAIDFFDLPPRDPRGQEAYLHASKKADGLNPGFQARKLTHFLSRLGYPCVEGAPLPAAACNLGNWVGRRVHASTGLEKEDPTKIDQQTGLPYPRRAQVKLFSYRASESTIRGASTAGQATGTGPLGQAGVNPSGTADELYRRDYVGNPARAAQPQPAGRTAAPSRIDAAGLNDL